MQDPGARRNSRRSFLKAAAASAAAVAAGPSLAPVSGQAAAFSSEQAWESRYSVCDMCFNKCGLIARIQNSCRFVFLDPRFSKSEGKQ